jgi:hypothetical protein
MTYGSAVHVYELGFNYFPKLHFFEAKKYILVLSCPLFLELFSFLSLS